MSAFNTASLVDTCTPSMMVICICKTHSKHRGMLQWMCRDLPCWECIDTSVLSFTAVSYYFFQTSSNSNHLDLLLSLTVCEYSADIHRQFIWSIRYLVLLGTWVFYTAKHFATCLTFHTWVVLLSSTEWLLAIRLKN